MATLTDLSFRGNGESTRRVELRKSTLRVVSNRRLLSKNRWLSPKRLSILDNASDLLVVGF